tara:strand:- start:909 stop:1562 length:654 start_codon:yes stop_codon:yes gene_type:complete
LPNHHPTRFAAGEDPAKRRQIIGGASRAFIRLGFDGASMNDIAREAGVSKGTIYVYFKDKEDLFGAFIEQERQRITLTLKDILAGSEDVEDGLYCFGIRFASEITSPQAINAMRTLIGVTNRMPTLCSRFFWLPASSRILLENFINRQVALDNLAVKDTDLAALQFIELVSGTFITFRLVGDLHDVPPQEELDYVVKSAIRIFMAAYGTSNPPRTAV